MGFNATQTDKRFHYCIGVIELKINFFAEKLKSYF